METENDFALPGDIGQYLETFLVFPTGAQGTATPDNWGWLLVGQGLGGCALSYSALNTQRLSSPYSSLEYYLTGIC